MYPFFSHLSVRKRMWMIVLLSVASFLLIQATSVFMLHKSLWHEREQKTQQLVETAYGVLAHYHQRQLKGEMSEEEAKAAAIAVVKSMRYGGREYFWLNDLGTPFPRMLMHPTAPELDGRLLDDDKLVRPTRQFSAEGRDADTDFEQKNIFVAFVEVANRRGEGFVAYDWPKPTADGGATSDFYAKLSFIKKFGPWGWVIGSGVYVDDVDSVAKEQALRQGVLIALIGLALVGLTLLISRSIVQPLRQLSAAMQTITWGERLKEAVRDGSEAERKELPNGAAALAAERGTKQALPPCLPVEGDSELSRLAHGFNDMLARISAHEAQLEGHREYLEAEVEYRTSEWREANQHLEIELGERERIERVLQEQRLRMRALLDAATESVMLLALDGTILSINAFGAQRFGMQPEAMLGTNFFSLMSPALAASRRAAVDHVATMGEPIQINDRRNGVSFHNALYPVKNDRGEVESIAVYAKDVTEQLQTKQIEEAFRHLDTALLKWQMNAESVAQIFCDDLLPVFDLSAMWIGRAEPEGGISVMALAEAGPPGFRDTLESSALRWKDVPAGGLPLEIVLGQGSRQLFTRESSNDSVVAWPEAAGAVLLLPLVLRGKDWGVLALYGRDAAHFDTTQTSAVRLTNIASRLGVTLEAALQQEWLTLLDSALDSVGNAVFITDPQARILWANRSAAKLTGYRPEEMIGQTPKLFRSGKQDADFYQRFWETIGSGNTWHGDIVNATPHGWHYTASQTVTPLRNLNGDLTHYVAILDDVTERKAMEERIRHSASYDLLTDLPNRGLFFDRLGQALSLARREGHSSALMFLDLDGFKKVNDLVGHAAGDYLLVEVARRLRGAVRESDTVARLGGDEFTVILAGIQTPEDAAAVADKILAAIAVPMVFEGQELKVGVSIGISLFPQEGWTTGDILNAADEAMYEAKKAGKNRYVFARGGQAVDLVSPT